MYLFLYSSQYIHPTTDIRRVLRVPSYQTRSPADNRTNRNQARNVSITAPLHTHVNGR